MSFAQPWLLSLLVVVVLAVVVWLRGIRSVRGALRGLSRGAAARPPYLAGALVALAAAAAIVAAAQPRWGTQETLIPRKGAQVIFVLDVSRSMAVHDVAPDRMAAAKQALIATVGRLGGDRVGVVIFAGDARTRFPLTSDLEAAVQIIASIEPGPVLVDGGTSASSGLDIAINGFDGTEAGRLMVLITDGDDLGADPAGVAQRIRDSGIELIVAGAGTPEGGPIPVFEAGAKGEAPKKDAQGNILISKLNEPFLRALAVAAGGRYAGSDLRSLPGIVEGRLTTLNRARFDRQAFTFPVERYQWFAGAALTLVALALLVEHRRGRRLAQVAGLACLVVILGGCQTRAFDLNEQGREALAAGDAASAIALFREAQAQQPDDAEISLNLAAALHEAGRYEEAAQAARRALNAREATQRGKAFASLGHHRFALEDLRGSLDAFRQALIENPRDDASRHDYEVVLRILFPPPPPEPDEGAPGGDPSATPEPGGTPEPGAPGGTPEPGQTPGSGNGEPGQGTPEAGQTPGAGGAQPGAGQGPGQGSGEPNRPQSPDQAEDQIAALDRQIATLLEESGDEPTAEEAFAILKLLEERARIAALRDSFGGASNPNDR